MSLRKFINKILNEHIFENAALRKLEKDNKYTLPKVPTRNVFFHDVANISSIRKNADEYIQNDKFETLPLEVVNVADIVPTQKSLTINNLKQVSRINQNTDAYLLKYNDKYYVLDGHHRIAQNILNGEQYIKAYVYEQK